jgi:DNA-directed RNA polymerase specialized sigma24 family protein|tara:strand:+ start:409 stop:903 length:495 start_codon:yes stop_codon:yes gene_type:complete
MSQKVMILVAKKHDTWVDIVSTFGCTRTVAEDITQEMYIKIQLQVEKGLDIMYQDDINYYYIFKTLKTLFLDLKRKQKGIVMVNIDDEYVSSLGKAVATEDVNFDSAYEDVKDELSKMYWWNRKVFEVVNEGESIAEFSRKSKISYTILYNAYKKVKKKLTKLI